MITRGLGYGSLILLGLGDFLQEIFIALGILDRNTNTLVLSTIETNLLTLAETLIDTLLPIDVATNVLAIASAEATPLSMTDVAITTLVLSEDIQP